MPRKTICVGPFWFRIRKTVKGRAVFFTFLRDPVDRVISYYTYCRYNADKNLEIGAAARKYELDDFLKFCLDSEKFRPHVWNNQVWQLSFGYGHRIVLDRPLTGSERSPEMQLSMAQRNLEDFDHIGFVDGFDRDAALIFRSLGIPAKDLQLKKANVSRDDREIQVNDASLLRIEEITRLDVLLVEYARSVAAAKSVETMPFEPSTRNKHARGLVGRIFSMWLPKQSEAMSGRKEGSKNKLPGHVFISGTGRAGTTFLVQLFTRLGLDTGYKFGEWNESVQDLKPGRDYFPIAKAGLERDPFVFENPQIVKTPYLCDKLDAVLAAGINIRNIIIPVRNLHDAAESRKRVQLETSGSVHGKGVAGGLWGTENPDRQEEVLGVKILSLIESAARNEIPMTFLSFPRFITDAEYLYWQVKPVFPELELQNFVDAHREMAKPELVHKFSKEDSQSVEVRGDRRTVSDGQ